MSEERKEIVGPGKFVSFAYKLYDDADGKLLFEATPEQPDVMIYGVSHEIVPGLVEVMKGLAKGDKFEITLPPVAAFGERSSEYELVLDKEIFMRDGKIADEVKVGAVLPMMTAEGYRVQGIVTEIGDKIKMDFNHPYAGKTVRYEGVIEEVRDATPEELKPQGGCCGGCGGSCSDGGCSDGDCGSGDCDSSCGCH